jgi:tetratricopeptide (TPR) repeat protein
MDAGETVYLFQHVMLREAAYQLQLPADRAALHLAAFESMHGSFPEDQQPQHAAELLEHLRAGAPRPMPHELAQLELEYLQAAADHAIQSWQGPSALGLLEDLRVHPLADEALQLDATLRLSSLMFRLGNGVQAAELLTTVLPRARAIGRAEEARWLTSLGSIYMQSGRPQDAASLLDQAIAIQREIGDEGALGRSLTHRAILMRHTGGGGNPAEMLDEALELNLRTGNEATAGTTLAAIGGLQRSLDRFEDALNCYGRALQIFRKHGARVDEAQSLSNQANVYLQLNRLDDAERAYLQALRTLRELGHRRSEAMALGNLGQLLWTRGRIGQCVAAQCEAVRVFEEINDLMLLPAFLAMLGGKLVALGEVKKAFTILERANRLVSDQQFAIATVDYVLPELLNLRITCCIGAFGRNAPPPDPAALAEVEEVLQRMQAVGTRAPRATTVIDATLDGMMRKVLALRASISEGKPAGLFNGRRLDNEDPELRKALLCRLEALAPESLQRLRQQEPDLYARLSADLADVPEPDWRSEELPG